MAYNINTIFKCSPTTQWQYHLSKKRTLRGLFLGHALSSTVASPKKRKFHFLENLHVYIYCFILLLSSFCSTLNYWIWFLARIVLPLISYGQLKPFQVFNTIEYFKLTDLMYILYIVNLLISYKWYVVNWLISCTLYKVNWLISCTLYIVNWLISCTLYIINWLISCI